MMLRLLTAALALILLPVAAHADWAPTKWGMSPEQVVAAVPGAVAMAHREGTVVLKHHKLAIASVRDGAFDVDASFYFEPRKRALAFIQFVPAPEKCDAYLDQIVARHGKGKRQDKGLGAGTMILIDWTDPATKEQLSFTGVKGSNRASIYCHFMQQVPA